jgi:hypothetical protein
MADLKPENFANDPGEMTAEQWANEESTFRFLFRSKTHPSEVVDPKERARYEAFIARQNAAEQK